jgi:anti-sigma B factor antagonist
MMGADFRVGIDLSGGPKESPLVTVEGEIDLAAASRLDEILDIAEEDSDEVSVDLSAVDYLDTAGVRVLFEHAARVRLVLLLAADGIIAPVIATSGLGRLTTVRTVER